MGNQISSRFSIVYTAARNGNVDVIKNVFENIQDSNHRMRLLEWQDSKGRTPLIVAAQKGHVSCVLELLERNANIHHISKKEFGGTALHEAVYYKWRAQGIVEALLRAGADPYAQNICGRTALDLALIENGDRRLFIPWVITFDSYGYVAEEMLVKSQSLNQSPRWMTRWVTVVPTYSSSDPSQRQCLKKSLIVYDGYFSRNLLSTIDLIGARAESQGPYLKLILEAKHIQPFGVTSIRQGQNWSIFMKATGIHAEERVNRFVSAMQVDAQTMVEMQLQNGPHVVSVYPPSLSDDSRSLPQTTNMISDQNHIVKETMDCDDLLGEEANDSLCVICLDAPRNAGFIHGDSAHFCCCRSCAFLVFVSDACRCPICRRRIDRISHS